MLRPPVKLQYECSYYLKRAEARETSCSSRPGLRYQVEGGPGNILSLQALTFATADANSRLFQICNEMDCTSAAWGIGMSVWGSCLIGPPGRGLLEVPGSKNRNAPDRSCQYATLTVVLVKGSMPAHAFCPLRYISMSIQSKGISNAGPTQAEAAF